MNTQKDVYSLFFTSIIVIILSLFTKVDYNNETFLQIGYGFFICAISLKLGLHFKNLDRVKLCLKYAAIAYILIQGMIGTSALSEPWYVIVFTLTISALFVGFPAIIVLAIVLTPRRKLKS